MLYGNSLGFWHKVVTFSGFTFPDEKSAPRISIGEELPLRILTAEFPKVPAAKEVQARITLTMKQ